MQPKTYLEDDGDNDVKSIVVVESGDGRHRVTENRGGEWCKPFWMPAEELESHDTEVVGLLPSDQYMRVCQQAGATQKA